MAERATPLAVLIANISGSAALLQLLGDKLAAESVGECLAGLRAAAARFGGTVVKTVGDQIIARFDSAIVSMPDGTSAAFYQRDPQRFRDLVKRTVEIHQRLSREWPRLAEQYRAALPEITSPETWAETFRPWTETQDEQE